MLTTVLTTVAVLAGAVVLAVAALAGGLARRGRDDGTLLVAPPRAEYGDATRLVRAALEERTGDAQVVHLHERRHLRHRARGHHGHAA